MTAKNFEEEYDKVLLNLSFTKDKDVGNVLNKLIPILMEDILTGSVERKRKLIEIANSCITRCKAIKKVEISLLLLIENFLDRLYVPSQHRFFYNRLYQMFWDIGFDSAKDEDKVKFMIYVFEHMEKFDIFTHIRIYMIMKFIDCLSILNNEANRKVIENYFRTQFEHIDERKMNFIKCLNEFMILPVVEDLNNLPFAFSDDVTNKYIEIFYKSRNYSSSNHMKYKKNVLNFLSDYVQNEDATFATYLIGSFENFDSVKEVAHSLYIRGKRHVNIDSEWVIYSLFQLLEYYDNLYYKESFLITILNLFKESSLLLKNEKSLDLFMSYIMFFTFSYEEKEKIQPEREDEENKLGLCIKKKYDTFFRMTENRKDFEIYLSKQIYKYKIEALRFNANIVLTTLDLCVHVLQKADTKILGKYSFFFSHLACSHMLEEIIQYKIEYYPEDYLEEDIATSENLPKYADLKNEKSKNVDSVTNAPPVYDNSSCQNGSIIKDDSNNAIEKTQSSLLPMRTNADQDNYRTRMDNVTKEYMKICSSFTTLCLTSLNNNFIILDLLLKILSASDEEFIEDVPPHLKKIINLFTDLKAYFKTVLRLPADELPIFVAAELPPSLFVKGWKNVISLVSGYIHLEREREKEEEKEKEKEKESSSLTVNSSIRNYYKFKSFKKCVVLNLCTILNKYVYLTYSCVLIYELLQFIFDVFGKSSLEMKYYSLLLKNDRDYILSCLARRNLSMHYHKRFTFDNYINYVSHMWFSKKEENTVDDSGSKMTEALFFLKHYEKKVTEINSASGLFEDIKRFELARKKLHIYNLESLYRYSLREYLNINVKQLRNLLLYIKKLKFHNIIYVESINISLLFLDILLMNAVNKKKIQKISFYNDYISILLTLLQKLKEHLNYRIGHVEIKNEDQQKQIHTYEDRHISDVEGIENDEEEKEIISENINLSKESLRQMTIESFSFFVKKRIMLIFNELLCSRHKYIMKKAAKVLVRIYFLSPKDNQDILEQFQNFVEVADFEFYDSNEKEKYGIKKLKEKREGVVDLLEGSKQEFSHTNNTYEKEKEKKGDKGDGIGSGNASGNNNDPKEVISAEESFCRNDSEKEEKNSESKKKRKLENTVCGCLLVFGHLLKKERYISKKYILIFQKAVFFILKTYIFNIKKSNNRFSVRLLEFCINFFKLVHHSKNFWNYWFTVVNENVYVQQELEECTFRNIILYSLKMFIEIADYARYRLRNICLFNKSLHYLSIFPLLKESEITKTLYEYIYEHLFETNIAIQICYGCFISEIFVKLDKKEADEMSATFLNKIIEQIEYEKKKKKKKSLKEKRNSLCIILYYIICKNPLLKIIKDHLFFIQDIFISNTFDKNLTYSEYGSLGISSLFFALVLQIYSDAIDIHELQKEFIKLMKENELYNETNQNRIFLLHYLEDKSYNHKGKSEDTENINDDDKNKDKDNVLSSLSFLKLKKNDSSLIENFISNLKRRYFNKGYHDILCNEYFDDENEMDKDLMEQVRICESRYIRFLDVICENIMYNKHFDLLKHYLSICNFIGDFTLLFFFIQNSQYFLFYGNYEEEEGKEKTEYDASDAENEFRYFFSKKQEDIDEKHIFKKLMQYEYTDFRKNEEENLRKSSHKRKRERTFRQEPLKNIKDMNESKTVDNYEVKNVRNVEHYSDVSRNAHPTSERYLKNEVDLKSKNKNLACFLKYLLKFILIIAIKKNNIAGFLKVFQHYPDEHVRKSVRKVEKCVFGKTRDFNNLKIWENCFHKRLINIKNTTTLITETVLSYVKDAIEHMENQMFIKELDAVLNFAKNVTIHVEKIKKQYFKFLEAMKKKIVAIGVGVGVGVGVCYESTLEADRNCKKNELSELQKTEENKKLKQNDSSVATSINPVLQSLVEMCTESQNTNQFQLLLLDSICCIVATSKKIEFDLECLLHLFLENSILFEDNTKSAKDRNREIDDSDFENDEDDENETFFKKLMKYNNRDKQKSVFVNIIRNYENPESIETATESFINSLKKHSSRSYVENVFFIIKELLKRHENITSDLLVAYEYKSFVFKLITGYIGTYIGTNAYTGVSSQVNELLQIVLKNIPARIYMKYLRNDIMKNTNSPQVSKNDKDVYINESKRDVYDDYCDQTKNKRMYAGSIILYLLKDNLLFEIISTKSYNYDCKMEKMKEYQLKKFAKKVKILVNNVLWPQHTSLDTYVLKKSAKKKKKNCVEIKEKEIKYHSLPHKIIEDILNVVEEACIKFTNFGNGSDESGFQESVLDDFYLEVKTKIINILQLNNFNATKWNCTLNELADYIYFDILHIWLNERSREKKKEEEWKEYLKEIEKKIVVRSFILQYMGIDKNFYSRMDYIKVVDEPKNNYRIIFRLLEKKHTFHFYKFFNLYIDEFILFLYSLVSFDLIMTYTSLDTFLDYFVNSYKLPNYDALDSSNIFKLFILYIKLKDRIWDDICLVSVIGIWAFLKIFNFIILLIYRSKNFKILKESCVEDNLEELIYNKKYSFNCCFNFFFQKLDLPASEEYHLHYFFNFINNHVLYMCSKCRGKESLRKFFMFLYNIPGIFVKCINFEKLLSCVIKIIHKYLMDQTNLSLFSSEFYYNITNLILAVFSFFLVKLNFKIWLNFYNYEMNSSYLNAEHLDFYEFIGISNYITREKNDLYLHLISTEQKNVNFVEELKRNLEDKCFLTDVNTDDNDNDNDEDETEEDKNSGGDTITISLIKESDSTSEERLESKKNEYFSRSTRSYQILKSKHMEINKKAYNFLKLPFSRNWEFFLRTIFHCCYNNYNVLKKLKTFFYFAFYNKLNFHEIGGNETWEHVYNCIYVGLFNAKKKKTHDQLVCLLNVLLCMYNSYGCHNKIDTMIHKEILILKEKAELGELSYIIKNNWDMNVEWKNTDLQELANDNFPKDINHKCNAVQFYMEENYVSKCKYNTVFDTTFKETPILQNSSNSVRKKIIEDNLCIHLCIFCCFKKMKPSGIFTVPDFLMNNLDFACRRTFQYSVC